MVSVMKKGTNHGLVVEHLEFNLENSVHFSDISFSINPGEIVLLAGASGSGKSTLAGVLTGYYPESGGTLKSGTISVSGQDLLSMDNQESMRYISASFQNARLAFAMENLYQELIFCLENKGFDPLLMDEMVKEHAKKTGVTELLERSFDVMSGGELQRANFSCLEIIDPLVYILDEPFSNLDDQKANELQETILELKKQNKIILVIDHRLDRWKFVDRMMVLSRVGQLLETDISLDPLSTNDHLLLEQEGLLSELEKPLQQAEVSNNLEPIFQIENMTIELGEYKTKWLKKTWHPDRVLLKSGNMHIYPGELIALEGKSGSGKSTIFQTILGEYPFDGTMHMKDLKFNSKNRKDWLSQIGLIFQDPSLQFLTTSCFDELNIGVQAVYPEKTEEETKKLITNLLKRHNLEDQASTSPWLLSQGQQRRLAVLCMLIKGQRLLLVDEPTYGQDKQNALEIMNNLNELRQDGTSIIFTSHDHDLVKHYADRGYVLENQELIEVSYDRSH